MLAVAKAPKPLTSTLVCAPFTPPYKAVSCTPGVCAMISCTVWAGERAISSAVITVDEAPTMPLNCLAEVAPAAGETFELSVVETFGVARRESDPSSERGLARVWFASRGGLTSIGGN